MKIASYLLALCLFASFTQGADKLTDAQRESLLEDLSDSLYMTTAIAKLASEEKSCKLRYELTKELADKGAVAEIALKEAHWKWMKTHFMGDVVKANLAIKEISMKLKEGPMAPKDVETLMVARWGKRLEAANAELARSENDKAYFAYSHAANVKLFQKGALGKEEFMRSQYLYEGSIAEVDKLREGAEKMAKIISEKP